MSQTKIEWSTHVWNPVTGCSPVSEGCRNCYARRMAQRLKGRCGYPSDDPFRVTLRPERLEEPFKWKKPRRVFVNSMGDIFHEDVPYEFLDRVFAVMGRSQHHVFLLLTKRPDRMQAYLKAGRYEQILDIAYNLNFRPEGMGMGISNPKNMQWWPNVWLGVTAENQQAADERIPILLQIPAAVRFVSCEPLLGPIDLRHIQTDVVEIDSLTGDHGVYRPLAGVSEKKLNWVIVGGETGPGARPMNPDWVRSLRDQCQAAGVPFFMKQMSKREPIPDDLLIREWPQNAI